MNGEVTDWIRGLGKFPEGSQVIFNPDGSVGAVMNGGKIYQPPEGVTYPSTAPASDKPAQNQYGYTEPEWQGMSDFDKGLAILKKDPIGGAIGATSKVFTDPLGTIGAAANTAFQWSAPWLGIAAVLGIGAIVLFVSLQALLKTGGE